MSAWSSSSRRSRESWRTLVGARNYCAIRGYISTMRKHDHGVLAGLRHLFEGDVWLPGGIPTT